MFDMETGGDDFGILDAGLMRCQAYDGVRGYTIDSICIYGGMKAVE